MKNRIKLTVLVFLLMLAKVSGAQDFYRTQNASVLITGVVNASVLQMQAHDATINLDYNTAEFSLFIRKSSLSTGHPEMDEALQNQTEEFIQITGQLGMEYVNTKDHPLLSFFVEGYLGDTDKSVLGNGSLEHIADGGTISCILTLSFNLSILDLNLNLEGFGIKNDIQINVLQAILSQD